MRSPPTYVRVETPEHDSATGVSTGASTRKAQTGAPRIRRKTGTITLMISSFVAGVIFAIAHHVYYSTLDGTLVGSAARQQWSIRFGTAFAFLVQVCLMNTAGIACIQWVWRRCHQQAVQISTIDAAFAVDRNLLMLLNLEFIHKFSIAAGLAVVFWCLPLSSLITPATLSVGLQPNTTFSTLPVNQPSINNIDSPTNSLYSPRSGQSSKLDQMFSLLSLTGERLPLTTPDNLQNISYAVDMIVPIIRCHESNDTVRSLTASAAYKQAISDADDGSNTNKSTTLFHPQNLTLTDEKNNYTGQIGYYGSPSDLVLESQENATIDQIYAVSELWIAIANPPEGTHAYDFPSSYGASYYTCSLRNASMTTNVTLVNNVQILNASNIQERDYIRSGIDSVAGNETSVLYAEENYESFAELLFTLLLGFVMNQGSNRSYGWHWNTSVEQTIFGTAKDFSTMTATWKDGGLGPDATTQDKNLTALIEEFSFNASWSLMGLPAFNNKVSARVNQTLWLNKYNYHSRNLFIAYGCSIFACLVTVLAGIYAIHVNGGSYDTRFSSISSVMQSPDVAALFGSQSTKARVLEKKIAQTKIKLHKNGGTERFRTDAEYVVMDTIRN